MPNNNEQFKELLGKMWSGDVLSMTTAEMNYALKNIMWQTFLIDAYKISINTVVGDGEGTIKILIEGDIYMDPVNLSNNAGVLDDMEIYNFTNDDNDDDDEINEKEDDED